MSNKLGSDLLNDLSVVVIDDDNNSLDVASIILEFSGAHVTVASDGKQGLESVRKVNPDLVLCDISMPIMDGWEFIQSLRNDTVHSNLNAIALTAHAMVGDKEKALSAGFDGYLTKPLNPETFVSQLLAVLEKAGISLT